MTQTCSTSLRAFEMQAPLSLEGIRSLLLRLLASLPHSPLSTVRLLNITRSMSRQGVPLSGQELERVRYIARARARAREGTEKALTASIRKFEAQLVAAHAKIQSRQAEIDDMQRSRRLLSGDGGSEAETSGSLRRGLGAIRASRNRTKKRLAAARKRLGDLRAEEAASVSHGH